MKTCHHHFQRAATLLLAALGCLLGLCGCTPSHAPLEYVLTFQPNPSNAALATIQVTASGPGAQSAFPKDTPAETCTKALALVRAGAAPGAESIAGRYECLGARLQFTPSFPLVAGDTYEARFNPAAMPARGTTKAGPAMVGRYPVPSGEAKVPPRIVALYPTTGQLPANHLKFYLRFSEPMRQGEFLQHIKLLDERDAEMPEPFRETELWSADGKRLTLWFHPGRQKTGVNLNVEIGPVLEVNRRYRLVISKAWASQDGIPLTDDFTKTFTTVAALHAQLDMRDWKITMPRAGTRHQLRVEFPTPLDWALLQNQIAVQSADGKIVEGDIEVGPAEASWHFTPAQAWAPGGFQLVAGGALEDLAGNSLARPFEVHTRQARPTNAPASFTPGLFRQSVT